MQPNQLLLALIILGVIVFFVGQRRALSLVSGGGRLHSLPGYYGSMTAIWAMVPALLTLLLWVMLESPVVDLLTLRSAPAEWVASQSSPQLLINEIHNARALGISADTDPQLMSLANTYEQLNVASGFWRNIIVLALALGGAFFAWQRIQPNFRARQSVESAIMFALTMCASIAILTTIGIIASVAFESWRFFGQVPPSEFLFGTQWSPQTALRADQVGSSGAFGAIPLFAGTLLISFIALLVAVPLGLMSAIYLAEYAPKRFRAMAKPALEILAGIPTVVYGFFAVVAVAPAIRGFGESIGLDVASESALTAGIVMGVMIIPFVSSLSDDILSAVPQAMRDGSYGLGSTKSETIRKVVLPAALPGIVGGFLLAASRAIGETMIVVMAAGLAANLTLNPLEAVTTVTVQIVTLLTGDQEFDSAKTLAAFALGLMLFATTLVLNIIALYVVRKYREQYE